MDRTLDKIAADLNALADENDAGHPIDSTDIRTAARRLQAQAEMIRENIVEWAQ